MAELTAILRENSLFKNQEVGCLYGLTKLCDLVMRHVLQEPVQMVITYVSFYKMDLPLK